MDDLKKLFEKLVSDFFVNKERILTPKVLSGLKSSITPDIGTLRYSTKSFHTSNVVGFNENLMIQSIRNEIVKLESVKNIVKWFIGKPGWIRKVESYEEDIRMLPSISANIVAGFLVRNFEINNYTFLISEASFQQAFSELIKFLNKDSIDIRVFFSLYGPSGDQEKIRLNNEAFIIRADQAIAEEFNRYYPGTDFYIDMYEGDYLIQLDYSIEKVKWQEIDFVESNMLKKWFLVPVLSGYGNVEKGKIIRKTEDWPLLPIRSPNSTMYNANKYNLHNKSDYAFTLNGIPLLDKAIKIVKEVECDRVDVNIMNAIDRIIKAKKASSLNDRVVELALALEYLINTQSNEVNLQLKAKGTILYNIPGEEEECFKIIGEFYKLRSVVVHGNTTLKNDSKTQETIKKCEIVILSIALRMLELNASYTYDEISKALHKALYYQRSFDNIISKSNTG